MRGAKTLGFIRGCLHSRQRWSVLFCLVAGPAYGLGLGDLHVQSALGEPLVAEVDVTSVSPSDLDTLEVTLGSREVFDSAGITRYEFLSDLEFAVDVSGAPVIRITSTQPIQEPFLHFIVRARWENGTLLTEYTALLDPPLYAEQQARPVSSPVVVTELEEAPAPRGQVEAQQPSPVEPPPQPVVSGVRFAGTQYGPTVPGDTLWGIATNLDTGDLDVNVFQVMIALLRDNPQAFIDNDINRLKTGQTLRLEQTGSIVSISKAEASRAYRNQIEGTPAAPALADTAAEDKDQSAENVVGDTPVLADAAPQQSDQPADSMEAEGPSQPTESGSEKYVFKIAPATADAASGTASTPSDVDIEIEAMRSAMDREIAMLRAQVADLEGRRPASDQSTAADGRGEIAILREQIAELKEAAAQREIAALRAELAALKGGGQPGAEPVRDFSDLSDQVEGAAGGRSSEAAAEIARVEADAQARIDAMLAEMAAMREAQRIRDEQNDELRKRVEQLLGQLEARVESGTLAAISAPQGAEPAEAASDGNTRHRVDYRTDAPAWWEQWLNKLPQDDTARLLIAVGLVSLLVIVWIIVRRRRSLVDLESSLLMRTQDSELRRPRSGVPNEKDSFLSGTKGRYLSELSMEGMGRMEMTDVDPLAEADLYLAYDRVPQAVQVLREASARDPERQDLKVRLLEIYQQEGDVDAFDRLVSEFNLGEGEVDNDLWNKVVSLRLKMHADPPPRVQEPDEARNVAPDVARSGAKTGSPPAPPAPPPHPLEPLEPALPPFPEPDRMSELLDEELESEGDLGEELVKGEGDDDQPAIELEDADVAAFASDHPNDLDFELDLGMEEEDALTDGDESWERAGAALTDEPGAAAKDDSATDRSRVNADVQLELAEAYFDMGEDNEALNVIKEIDLEHLGSTEQKNRMMALIKRAKTS